MIEFLARNWPLVVLAVVIILSAAAALVAYLRRKFTFDDNAPLLWDTIEEVLRVLREIAGGLLHNLTEEQVRDAAAAVYDTVLADSPLASIVSRAAFCNLVVERWKALATVSTVVKGAVKLA